MLKIRVWGMLPEMFEDLVPKGAYEVEVVDTDAIPIDEELAKMIDHDIWLAYEEGGKVYVMTSPLSRPEQVPDDLVRLVPKEAYEAYKNLENSIWQINEWVKR